MKAWRGRWPKSWLVFVAMLAMASGVAWAAAREVPPLSELPPVNEWSIPQQLPAPAALPPEKAWPGWQEFLLYREGLRWFGGIVLGLMAVLVLIHFAIYGGHHVRPTGRLIRRYSWVEVLLHGLLTLSFAGAWASSTYLILANYILGYAEEELAVPLGRLWNTVHITSGLLFLGSLMALAVIWLPRMGFVSYDREWLRHMGGYFSRRHEILPAGRFNAGQKIWFRVSILFGVLVSVSGALIYYPALLGPRGGILLYAVHTALGVGLSAAAIAHVYLAVLAHSRSARSMITGTVDEACVREDHPLELIPAEAKRSL